jgi:hypothetical protein
LVLVAAACRDTSEVMAPPPVRMLAKDNPVPPELPPTIVNVPVLLDFGSAVQLMEAELPKKLGDIEEKKSIPGKKRTSYAFQIRREALTVNLKADTFFVATTIHYQGRVWYDPPIGPEVSASCGTKGDEPRARIVLSVRPSLTAGWRLEAKPRLVHLGPLTKTERDQCEVSFLSLDMTGKVLDAARDAITALLPKLGEKLAGLDVKSEFEKVWNEIQKPIHLADSVWLLLDPTGIRLGRLGGNAEMVGGTIGVNANPKIETGPKPMVAYRPVPPLDTAAAETGLNLLLEGRFDYGVIGKSLTDELKGTEIKTPGGAVQIQELAAYGVGGGRIALGVRFTGTASGQIFFVGTPRYDPETGKISVPDLDFDASTTPLLVKGLAWLRDRQIRDLLRAQATFPSGDAMDKIATVAVDGMNRELTTGIILSASINESKVVAITPRHDALYLQAHATGQAALHVTEKFFEKLKAEGQTDRRTEGQTDSSSRLDRKHSPSKRVDSTGDSSTAKRPTR